MAPLISPADGVSEEEFKKKFAEWKKALGEAAEKLNSRPTTRRSRAKAQQRYQELYQQRSEFMKEDRTGFIWLYLRK